MPFFVGNVEDIVTARFADRPAPDAKTGRFCRLDQP